MTQTIELDYPVLPKIRYDEENPHLLLSCLFSKGNKRYARLLGRFAKYSDNFKKISLHADPSSPHEPYWKNGWIPAIDAISIYGFIAEQKPSVYFEIGSGNSTKFARRAIRDGHLTTRIISVDPCPRAEINDLCDTVIREPVENIDKKIYASLPANSVVYIDNSHRCFQNSDVTVCFLDILPALPIGVTVGIHDIMLPYDYSESWFKRYYNEQYVLAAFLLGGGGGYKILLPCRYAYHTPEVYHKILPVFETPELKGLGDPGGAFWMSRKK